MTPLCIFGHRSFLNFHGALLHNLSWTHEKAGHIKEAIDYAARYQAAVHGEDQERARRRVEFLKQRY